MGLAGGDLFSLLAAPAAIAALALLAGSRRMRTTDRGVAPAMH
jgi:hypothetical protein